MIFQDIIQQADTAKKMSHRLARLSSAEKNRILVRMADALHEDEARLLAANAADVQAAEKAKLNAALMDRLRLTPQRIASMAKALREIAELEDPVGKILETISRPNGLRIEKMRVPIGVIAMIYESRPNVTTDAAGLCLKSGNAVILKGGKEAFASNEAIVKTLHRALKACGAEEYFVQMVKHTDREAVDMLLKQKQSIDLVIPRGGKGLIEKVVEQSLIPVLKHDQGICHVYVDESCDEAMAEQIVLNAKCQRPGVCNAMETLLVHERVAPHFLPKMGEALKAKGVRLVGCLQTRSLLKDAAIEVATEDSWRTEYLDLVLSVRVVADVRVAIDHINTYGSQHSDAIVTSNKDHAALFLREVHSAAVYHNASTRFTDGGEFGRGAEIGISTDKIHARGPVGLEELTTYKYIVYGEGQTR